MNTVRAHYFLPLLISILSLATLVPTSQAVCRLQNDDAPPLLEQLKRRTDRLSFDAFVQLSTVEAEQFRQTLLVNNARRARMVAAACAKFQQLDALKAFSKQSGYSTNRFINLEAKVLAGIQGTSTLPDPQGFYGSFKGKWFGRWTENDVDHHWGDYVELGKPISFSTGDDEARYKFELTGHQWAWVGDGYGLNHVVRSTDGLQNYLLGYVVHIRDQDPLKETARRPHVGVVTGERQLVWITKSEVFLEETLRGETRDTDRYFITGFRYTIGEDKTLKANEAFQTVYSRNSTDRKPWRGSNIDLKVDPPTDNELKKPVNQNR